MAVDSVSRHLTIAFLERIKEDFTNRYSGGKAATASAKSLNKEFGYSYISLIMHDALLCTETVSLC